MAPVPKTAFAAVRIESDADRLEETAVPTEKAAATAANAIEVEIGDATIRAPVGVGLGTLDAVVTAPRGAR
jgi:hypothetical protein